ncbi:MAG: hypothetical protein ACYS8W_09120 [Planctomycetota bacterium]
MSGVDTFTSGPLTSLAMSECYLYTLEGISTLYSRLKQGGILSYCRWHSAPPSETMRLVNTMIEVLKQNGIPNAHDHIFSVAASKEGVRWTETLLKNSPFTAREIDQIMEWAAVKEYVPLIVPGVSIDGEFKPLFQDNRDEFIAGYSHDISVATDDHPFFFNFYFPRHVFSGELNKGSNFPFPLAWKFMMIILIILSVLSTLFILGPLFIQNRHRLTFGRNCPMMIYTAMLGCGFIFFELVVIHHFRLLSGSTVLALALALGTLLSGAGLGSLYSAHKKITVSGLRYVISLILCGFIIYAICAYTKIFYSMAASALAIKITVSIILLIPIGFLLGIPLPTALKVFQSYPRLTPWAWGINGFFTVIGATTATMMAHFSGYRLVLACAFMCYLIVLLIADRALAVPHSPNKLQGDTPNRAAKQRNEIAQGKNSPGSE